MLTKTMKVLVQTLMLIVVAAMGAKGDATAPCNTNMPDDSVVIRATDTLCMSSTGFTNSWYPNDAALGVVTPSKNVLGESSQYLFFTNGSGMYGGWLNSNNGVDTGFFVRPGGGITWNGTVATSSLTYKSGGTDLVQVDISTAPGQGGFKMTFGIKNLAGSAITDMNFYEYLIYYPYGADDQDKGTLFYQPVPTMENTYKPGLWGTAPDGNSWSGIVRSGGVCGGWGDVCGSVTHYQVGDAATVRAQAAGNVDLADGATSAANPAGGALQWDTPVAYSLASGDTQNFTLELVPEPGTWTMLALGAGLLVAAHRRRRKI